MINKKNYIKIGLIVVIFFNLFILYRYFNIRDYCYKLKLECDEKEQSYLYDFKRDLKLMSEKICIEKDSIFKNKISLKPKLVFVYSGNECEKCIFQNIEKIKARIGERVKEDLIVLPIFEYSRNKQIALESTLNGLKYVRLDPESIQVPNYNGSFPLFYAIFLPNGEVVLPFSPNSGDDARTDSYLDYVFEKYF